MTINGSITKMDLAGATADALSALPKNVQDAYRIQVDEDAIYHSEGGWIIPIDISPSAEGLSAYELDRVLADVQEKIERRLNTFATIVIQP